MQVVFLQEPKRSRKSFSLVVQFPRIISEIIDLNGGVAHLGERLNGIQEVVGSIPIVSTRLSSNVERKYVH